MHFRKSIAWVGVAVVLSGLCGPVSAEPMVKLSGPEVKRLIVGKRWFFKMYFPFDMTFTKAGTFSIPQHTRCESGVKNTYDIDGSGQITFVFKNCNGKVRERWWMTVHKRGTSHYLRNQFGAGLFKMHRR